MLAATSKGYPILDEKDWPWVTTTTKLPVSDGRLYSPQMQLKNLNSSSILVTWNPSSSHENITGYKLYYQCGEHPRIGPVVHVRTANYQILDNLLSEKLYKVKLQAFNKNGDGRFVTKSIKTLPASEGGFESKAKDQLPLSLVPHPPINVTVSVVSPTSVKILWTSPTKHKINDVQIVRYTVKYRAILPNNPGGPNVSNLRFQQSDRTETLITDLRPAIPYEFCVSSHTQLRAGEFSSQVRQIMPEDIPSCPVDVLWEPKSTTSGTVSWQPPLHTNGNLKEYTVHYQLRTRDDFWMEKSVSPKQNSINLKDLRPHSNYKIKITTSNLAGRCLPSESYFWTIGLPDTPQPAPWPLPDPNQESVGNDPAIHEFTGVVELTQQESSHSTLGIAIGVATGLLCIILCLLALSLRNQFIPRNSETSYHSGYDSKNDIASSSVLNRALQTNLYSNTILTPENKKHLGFDCNLPRILHTNPDIDEGYDQRMAMYFMSQYCHYQSCHSCIKQTVNLHGKTAYEYLGRTGHNELESNSSDSGFNCPAYSKDNPPKGNARNVKNENQFRSASNLDEREFVRIPSTSSCTPLQWCSVQNHSHHCTMGSRTTSGAGRNHFDEFSKTNRRKSLLCGKCGQRTVVNVAMTSIPDWLLTQSALPSSNYEANQGRSMACDDVNRDFDTSAPSATSSKSGDAISTPQIPSTKTQDYLKGRDHCTKGLAMTYSTCLTSTNTSGHCAQAKEKEYHLNCPKSEINENLPLLNPSKDSASCLVNAIHLVTVSWQQFVAKYGKLHCNCVIA